MNTSSYSNWNTIPLITGNGSESDVFGNSNSGGNCQARHPCVKIKGIGDVETNSSRFYIEQTVNTSAWSDMSFGIAISVRSFESDDYAFFETVCDGDVKTDTSWENDQTKKARVTKYSQCFDRETPCDEMIVRVGGYLNKNSDILWITQIVYSEGYVSDAPTSDPSRFPTMIPTSNPTQIASIFPTSSPILQPTIIPTLSPTMIPTSNPTQNPTLIRAALPAQRPIATLSPTMIPTSNPTQNPSFFPTMSPTMIPTQNPTLYPSKPSTHNPSLSAASFPTLIRSTSNPTEYSGEVFVTTIAEFDVSQTDETTLFALLNSRNIFFAIIVIGSFLSCALVCIVVLVKNQQRKRAKMNKIEKYFDSTDLASQVQVSTNNLNGEDKNIEFATKQIDVVPNMSPFATDGNFSDAQSDNGAKVTGLFAEGYDNNSNKESKSDSDDDLQFLGDLTTCGNSDFEIETIE